MTLSPVTGRRRDYTTISVDIGVTDVTKNSRLFTVTSTTCSMLLLAVFFPSIDIQQSTSPAHPVSVPIRHASDKSSVVTSFETGICIHRKYNKIPGTCAVYTHACGGWAVFLEYGCGAPGIFKSPAFTYDHGLLSASHYFSFLGKRSGRMPPAERSAL